MKNIVDHEDHGNYDDFNGDVLMMMMTGELLKKIKKMSTQIVLTTVSAKHGNNYEDHHE